jgi:hypothetical protein
VSLDARNVEAVKVLFAVRSQYVVIGPRGYPIAVKVEAVTAAIELFNVVEKERVFLRVTKAINGHFIKKIQRKFEK